VTPVVVSLSHQAIYLLLTNILDVTPVVVSLSHQALKTKLHGEHFLSKTEKYN
jgi:hypothetical protein